MRLSTRRPPPPPGVPEFQKRQADWSSAASIAEQFPRAGSFSLDFRLRDPSGVRAPTPFKQTYEPQMRAYFDMRCPLHDCRDGGFPLSAPVLDMLRNPKAPRSGTAVCTGERLRNGKREPCALEITYTLVPVEA